MIGEQFSVQASHGAGSTSSDRGSEHKFCTPDPRVTRSLAVSTLDRQGEFGQDTKKLFFDTCFRKGIEDNQEINELYETYLILYV